MNKFKKIFGKEKKVVIGALHFPPLLGYKEFPGFELALKNAILDLKAFSNGGVDSIICENNYDIPHKALVDSSVASSMTYLINKLKQQTKLSLGVSVLWNDYLTALAVSKTLDLAYIRIPVFVDKVKTSYGTMIGDSAKVRATVKKLGAEKVALFTDIHVKHAQLISKHSLIESARLAIKHGSDAIILTGKWTGDAPAIEHLRSVRKHVGSFPIIIGSGADAGNIKELLKYVNGVIVSTSLKNETGTSHRQNIKPYTARISLAKVKNLVRAAA